MYLLTKHLAHHSVPHLYNLTSQRILNHYDNWKWTRTSRFPKFLTDTSTTPWLLWQGYKPHLFCPRPQKSPTNSVSRQIDIVETNRPSTQGTKSERLYLNGCGLMAVTWSWNKNQINLLLQIPETNQQVDHRVLRRACWESPGVLYKFLIFEYVHFSEERIPGSYQSFKNNTYPKWALKVFWA